MAKKIRPLEYTDELADVICSLIAMGKTLSSVCAVSGMPQRSTVMNWVLTIPGFALQYAKARELQAEYFFDLIADAAEGIDASSALSVQAAKLRIDTLKWAAANVLSVRCGSGLAGSGESGLQTPEGQSDLEPLDAYQQMLKDAAEE